MASSLPLVCLSLLLLVVYSNSNECPGGVCGPGGHTSTTKHHNHTTTPSTTAATSSHPHSPHTGSGAGVSVGITDAAFNSIRGIFQQLGLPAPDISLVSGFLKNCDFSPYKTCGNIPGIQATVYAPLVGLLGPLDVTCKCIWPLLLILQVGLVPLLPTISHLGQLGYVLGKILCKIKPGLDRVGVILCGVLRVLQPVLVIVAIIVASLLFILSPVTSLLNPILIPVVDALSKLLIDFLTKRAGIIGIVDDNTLPFVDPLPLITFEGLPGFSLGANAGLNIG